jgi:hypothetical protein
MRVRRDGIYDGVEGQVDEGYVGVHSTCFVKKTPHPNALSIPQ